MSITKSCQECGQQFETTRANAKRCHLCRLRNDLEFINDYVVPCWQCGDAVAPLKRGDKTCGHCAYAPKKHGMAECVQCHNVAPQIEKDVPVCHTCAKHPDHRRWLLRAVRDKCQARNELAQQQVSA